MLSISAFISGMTALPVKAYGYDTGSNYPSSTLHACDADPTSEMEVRNVTQAFSEIYDMYSTRGIYWWDGWYWEYYGRTYSRVTNSMEGDAEDPNYNNIYSTTTEPDIINDIYDVETIHNHQYSSFLYVGHTNSQPDSNSIWRYGFFMSGKGQNVLTLPAMSDETIHSYANANHNFVFLWVCRCAQEYGGENNPANGMPYCWTNGAISDNDGYSVPNENVNYCLIGFDGASPYLSTEHHGSTHTYKHWLVFFYYYALVNTALGLPINEALDAASQQQDYYNFNVDRLRVRGSEPPYPKAASYTDPNCDIEFPGIRDPENPSVWKVEPGPYDAWMKVYGNGGYTIPNNFIIP